MEKKKITIWWILDDSQINSRQWRDWGARTSYEPNEPYLKLCLRRAREVWNTPEEAFEIVPLIGRSAVHEKLESAGLQVPEGASRVPPNIWSPWCRAAFLNRFGGLWLDGSVLPIQNSGPLLRERLASAPVLTFGTDPDEGLCSAEESAPATGRSAGWASVPGHPMWSGMERDIQSLIEAGDQSWGAAMARRFLRWSWDKHCVGVTAVDRKAEVSRDQYGRRLELETLLGESAWEGDTKGGIWLPFPDGRDNLERASHWLWFLRMSEEQIAESDFLWAKLSKSS